MRRIQILVMTIMTVLLTSALFGSEKRFTHRARDFKKNLKQEISLTIIEEVRVIKRRLRIAGAARTEVNNKTDSFPSDMVELELPLDSTCKSLAESGVPYGKILFITGDGSAVRHQREDGNYIGLINLKVLTSCEVK